LKGHIRLIKFKIVELLLFTSMGSAIFSTKGNIGTFLIIVLALTMGIASLGKKFLNHYYDKYIDVMYVTISRLSPLREINLDVYS